VVHDDDVDVDATAGIVESASGTDIDDDTTTQDNHADVSVAASAPTPRRLRDLPARRKAAASQPLASTSQSQSTICPVCLWLIIVRLIVHVDTVCLCCTCLQPLTATATGCARCPVCRTDISDSLRLYFSA